MAYVATGKISSVNLTNIDDTPLFQIGTETDVYDSTYGAGVAIYLPGVASLAVGNAVTYNSFAGTVIRSITTSGATSKGQIAIALSANTSATDYSWYLIAGVVSATAGTIAAANTPVFVSAVAGTLDDSGAGYKLSGAIWRSTDSGGVATLQLYRPFADGDS